MFEMMKMMGKLKEAKKKVEETKSRLEKEYLSEQSGDGLLEVTLSTTQKIQSLSIDNSLLQDKERLEACLISTLNEVLARARDRYEKALTEAAKEGLPNIPGLPF